MKHGKFVVHVVDPDQAITDALEILLDTYGIEVSAYRDAETFLESWSPQSAGRCCLLCEADLPGLSGPALLHKLCEACEDLPVLLLVSTASPALLEAAQDSSRVGFVEKPFVNDGLINSVLQLRDAA